VKVWVIRKLAKTLWFSLFLLFFYFFQNWLSVCGFSVNLELKTIHKAFFFYCYMFFCALLLPLSGYRVIMDAMASHF